MKKTLIIVISLIVVAIGSYLFFMSISNNKANNNNTKEENMNMNFVSSDNYISFYSNNLNSQISFKPGNPTFFWNSGDNFGAAEIDTVLLVSKNGLPIDNYYDIGNVSAIIFETDSRFFSSTDKFNEFMQKAHNISNAKIELTNSGLFSRHVVGENEYLYLEAYCGVYKGINYVVELNIYKNNYSNEDFNLILNEYNNIINTIKMD